MELRVKVVIVGVSLMILSASGCGLVSRGLNSDKDLLERAGRGTGVDPSELTIVPGSVSGDMAYVHFQVRDTEGAVYECKFDSIIVQTGYTNCTQISGPIEPVNQPKKRSRKRSSGSTSSQPAPASGGSDDFELEGAGHS